jgi:hypothetical protein
VVCFSHLRFWSRYLVSGLALCLALHTAESQTPKPSPAAPYFANSPELTAALLPETRMQALTAIVQPNPQGQAMLQQRQNLCGSMDVQMQVAEAAPRVALAKAQSGIAAEIFFEQPHTDAENAAPASFSVYIQFKADAVLLRSSKPRYSNEQDGVIVPYARDIVRPLWSEGEKGSSIFAFIPPTGECAVEAVLLCPRTPASTGELAASNYSPVGWKLTSSAKSDAVYGPAAGTRGRLQASILGSPGVVLPDPWFQQRSGTVALSASRQTPTTDTDGESVKAPRVGLRALPAVAAVESRMELGIELGSETSRQRIVSSRSSLQLSELRFTQPYRAIIGSKSFQIEPGPCYLVAGWTEKLL